MLSTRARALALALVLSCLGATAVVVGSALPAAAEGEGKVFPFGRAAAHGEPAGADLAGAAATPSGNGYWTLAGSGSVSAYGDAPRLGSAPSGAVDIVATPTGKGYWVALAGGGVLAFGDARFYGSMGRSGLAQPIVGMASMPGGDGYWLVAADGGVFSFGSARFLGSTGHLRLNSPIVGVAATPAGDGYWFVAADGGVFAFGAARFHGSLAGTVSTPVTAMAATPTGGGYWMVTEAGDVRPFGDAADLGGFGGEFRPPSPVTDIAARRAGDGYWLTTGAAPPTPLPTYEAAGEPSDADFDRLAQCESGGRWNLSSGNGYYGGLQFSAPTWRGVGGTGLPHEHPRETQIEMGRRLWRRTGWSSWPHCARQLGWR